MATKPTPDDDQEKEKDAPKEESPLLDNEQTDAAVDDIVHNEGDQLLEAQDHALADKQEAPKEHWIKRWWHNKWARWTTIILLLLIMGVAAGYPTSRYALLNAAGVRISSSLTVVDGTTGQPLKNAKVTIGETTAMTNQDGEVRLMQLRLGPQHLKISRTAFASYGMDVTLGWGSNPLGIFKMKAIGVQYVLHIQDYANKQAIANVEATSGEAAALSDKTGKLVLTINGTGDADVPVTIKSDGYRTEQLVISAGNTDPRTVTLVPAKKEIFVAKQNGVYNLYKIDVDGQNQQLLLAGTGSETGTMSLAVSPAGDQVAFVSTRENKRATNGTLLNVLSLVRVSDGSKLTLDTAAQIQLLDWVGNRLVFRVSGVSDTADAPLHAVVSYDYKTSSRAQLASANNLVLAMSAQGTVFYATGPSEDAPDPVLYRIRPDGSGKQKLLDKEVWSGVRASFDAVNFQTAEGWYAYSLSEQTIAATDVDTFTNHVFIDHQNKPQSLWVDTRDGKNTLLLHDGATGKDQATYVQSGLTQPVRWLNDTTAIVRVVTGTEIADYVVGLKSGTAIKIANVTNTFGFTQSQ